MVCEDTWNTSTIRWLIEEERSPSLMEEERSPSPPKTKPMEILSLKVIRNHP
jgi:hypothetical protein